MERDIVHLWQVETALLDARSEAHCLTLLDAAERAHHARLQQREDRRAYLFAHALLRRVLTRLFGVPEPEWRLQRTPYGRPELCAGQTPLAVDFNLSHTRGGVALALACGRRVGVDLEGPLSPQTAAELRDMVCSAGERRRLYGVHADALAAAIQRLWVVKEAYLKGIGSGLSRDPARLDCHLGEGGGVQCHDPDADDRSSWALRLWDLGRDHTLALAYTHACGESVRVALADGAALLADVGEQRLRDHRRDGRWCSAQSQLYPIVE